MPSADCASRWLLGCRLDGRGQAVMMAAFGMQLGHGRIGGLDLGEAEGCRCRGFVLFLGPSPPTSFPKRTAVC